MGEFSGMSSQTHLPHCRVLPPGEFNVVIPEPHITLHGAVTWRNQCHNRATWQSVRIASATLKIVFRHILFYFVFLNAAWALTSGGFRIVFDTLVSSSVSLDSVMYIIVIYMQATMCSTHILVHHWSRGEEFTVLGQRGYNCFQGVDIPPKGWLHKPLFYNRVQIMIDDEVRHQSTATNAVSRRFSYNAHNAGAGGDFVTHRWPPHQAHQQHHHHPLQRHQTVPFSGCCSSSRYHDAAPGAAGGTTTIPVVNGVSSGRWRQQRNIASGNTVHPASLPCDRNHLVSITSAKQKITL